MVAPQLIKKEDIFPKKWTWHGKAGNILEVSENVLVQDADINQVYMEDAASGGGLELCLQPN